MMDFRFNFDALIGATNKFDQEPDANADCPLDEAGKCENFANSIFNLS